MKKHLFVAVIVVIAFICGFLLGIHYDCVTTMFSSALIEKKISSAFGKYAIPIISVIFSGVIGYFLGAVKSFRDEKQTAYGAILPPVIKMAYHPEKMSEPDFNKALTKLWLYGSKTVIKKMDWAVSILIDRRRGNLPKALQEATVAMRKDIQISPLQRIKPEEVKHLYARIGEYSRENNSENKAKS